MPPGVPDAQGCIYSGAAIHFKRHLDVLNQLVIDAEIEVIHIAAPVAGGGNNPVCLAGVGIILLLIIQKVSIEFTHNVILVAEHEKSCGGGMFFHQSRYRQHPTSEESLYHPKPPTHGLDGRDAFSDSSCGCSLC